MALVLYPSLADADVIDVSFLKLDGEVRSLPLLVDTGFTGSSCFVLPDTAVDLVRAALPPQHTTGAIQGMRERGWVTCRIAGLNYQATVRAIISDTSSLALPPGVAGLAGLAFLRQFASWGGRRIATAWQFFLSNA